MRADPRTGRHPTRADPSSGTSGAGDEDEPLLDGRGYPEVGQVLVQCVPKHVVLLVRRLLLAVEDALETDPREVSPEGETGDPQLARVPSTEVHAVDQLSAWALRHEDLLVRPAARV